jgi:hypothetical protein
MAELILRGKFFELLEYCYYRRMSPDSATIDKSKTKIRRFNNPNSYGKINLSDTKFQFRFFSAVFHSQLKLDEKIDLYKFLVKARYWQFRNRRIIF